MYLLLLLCGINFTMWTHIQYICPRFIVKTKRLNLNTWKCFLIQKWIYFVVTFERLKLKITSIFWNKGPVKSVNLCVYDVTDNLSILDPDIIPGVNGTTTPTICSGLEMLTTGCVVQVLCPMWLSSARTIPKSLVLNVGQNDTYVKFARQLWQISYKLVSFF